MLQTQRSNSEAIENKAASHHSAMIDGSKTTTVFAAKISRRPLWRDSSAPACRLPLPNRSAGFARSLQPAGF